MPPWVALLFPGMARRWRSTSPSPGGTVRRPMAHPPGNTGHRSPVTPGGCHRPNCPSRKPLSPARPKNPFRRYLLNKPGNLVRGRGPAPRNRRERRQRLYPPRSCPCPIRRDPSGCNLASHQACNPPCRRPCLMASRRVPRPSVTLPWAQGVGLASHPGHPRCRPLGQCPPASLHPPPHRRLLARLSHGPRPRPQPRARLPPGSLPRTPPRRVLPLRRQRPSPTQQAPRPWHLAP